MHRRSLPVTFLICALLSWTGCHHSEGHGPSDHGAGHDAHGSELQLTLDHGEKWPTDEHTRTSAAKLTELVEGSEPLESVEDARALAEALDTELNSLVKGCTMTGAAHDQLHVFLVALFPKVEELNDKTDVADLEHVRGEIGSLFDAYADHFE